MAGKKLLFRKQWGFDFDPNSYERYELQEEEVKKKKKKKKFSTSSEIRKKQGPGFWQADIGED